MIRLIAVISMILMPIISVSTGSTESETVLRSRDHLDQRGNCSPECGEMAGQIGVAFVNGSK